jgi:hypothetical protein
MAFNTHLFTRLPHLQAFHVEFLPLALWALDRVLRDARVRDALALAASALAQSLCSGYLLVFTGVSLVAAMLARVPDWLPRSRPTLRRAALAAAAAGLTGVLLVPFLLPYARLRAQHGLVRPVAEVALYSAEPRDYLTTVARIHYRLWSGRFYEPGTDALFPGALALGLAAFAIGSGLAMREPQARMLLFIGVAGVTLSFGPVVPGYRLLYEQIPLLQGIRGAARFGYLGTVAVAGLAAFGLAAIGRRSEVAAGAAARSRWAVLVGVAAIAVVNLEAWSAPIAYTRFDGISRIYRVLAHEPSAVVVELPFPAPRDINQNAPAVLAAAYHLRPLVNGYSGFVPTSYAENATALATFPDAASFAHLRRLGVTHLVVHYEAFGEAAAARRAVDTEAALVAVSGGDTALYRLRQ